MAEDLGRTGLESTKRMSLNRNGKIKASRGFPNKIYKAKALYTDARSVQPVVCCMEEIEPVTLSCFQDGFIWILLLATLETEKETTNYQPANCMPSPTWGRR